MTDEQFSALQQLILELRMEISALKLSLKARHSLEDERFKLIFSALYEDPDVESRTGEIYGSDELADLIRSRAPK